MNQAIQSRLDRIDLSLSTLIDSITSYNPSIPAAQDLLAADDDLNEGVQQLVTHQRNHARITSLRFEIDSLNATISSNLTSLAELRSDILSQNIAPVTDTARQVPYRELLDYAQRISRYTVPPALVLPLSITKSSEPAKDAAKGEVNGVSAEPAATAEGAKQVEAQASTVPQLSGFVPWPSEEVIRQGALGNIKSLIEQGLDPSGIAAEGGKPPGEVAEEGIKEQQPEPETARSDQLRRPQENVAMAREAPREEKPKVFGGLDLYDPDEE